MTVHKRLAQPENKSPIANLIAQNPVKRFSHCGIDFHFAIRHQGRQPYENIDRVNIFTRTRIKFYTKSPQSILCC
jgi:hypothetical protein